MAADLSAQENADIRQEFEELAEVLGAPRPLTEAQIQQLGEAFTAAGYGGVRLYLTGAIGGLVAEWLEAARADGAAEEQHLAEREGRSS